VKGLGLTPPLRGWLGDPNISIWMVLIVAAWQYTGFMMVLILAGLQGIPKEHYEAAALDGARGPQGLLVHHAALDPQRVAGRRADHHDRRLQGLRFRVRASLRADQPTPPRCWAPYIYLQAFNLNNMGYANAIAVVLAGDRCRPGLDAAKGEPEGMMSRFRLAAVVLYGFVSLWSLFVLLPAAVDGVRGFQDRREIFTDPLGLPTR